MLCEAEPDMEEAQLKDEEKKDEREDVGLGEAQELEQTTAKVQINLSALHSWVY